MKKIILFFGILTSLPSLCQVQIESNFNSVSTGRNQSLMINYKHNKLQFGVGVKYNFNKLANFPQDVFYKKTFYALKPIEHWGAELNFKYQVFNRKAVFFAHIFVNSQFTKSHTRFESFFAIGQTVENPTSELDYIYVKHISNIGPFLVFENNLGLAFDIYLSEKLYLSQKFGVGILIHKNLDLNTTIVGGGNWVFSEMLSFGVGYKL